MVPKEEDMINQWKENMIEQNILREFCDTLLPSKARPNAPMIMMLNGDLQYNLNQRVRNCQRGAITFDYRENKLEKTIKVILKWIKSVFSVAREQEMTYNMIQRTPFVVIVHPKNGRRKKRFEQMERTMRERWRERMLW